jgi:hypothetical protein
LSEILLAKEVRQRVVHTRRVEPGQELNLAAACLRHTRADATTRRSFHTPARSAGTDVRSVNAKPSLARPSACVLPRYRRQSSILTEPADRTRAQELAEE